MQIVILGVGKLKERYWREAEAEYRKRLSPHASCVVEEVADEADTADATRGLRAEGDRILARLRDRDYVIALDIVGKKMTSEQFADHLATVAGQGHGRYVFLIGGSHGLAHDVLQRAQLRLSFSDFTFPHQMMRIILLEQMYRAFRIQAGHPYHK